MHKITTAFFVTVLIFLANTAQAQSDTLLKHNDIRVLLELMQVGPSMQTSLMQEIAVSREGNEEGLPPQFWDEFEKEAMSSVAGFIERLVPAYAVEFTHQEIKSLIEIYQDPVMRKLSASEATLGEASARAGQAWGEEIGLRVAMRLEEQGIGKEPLAPASDKARKPKK